MRQLKILLVMFVAALSLLAGSCGGTTTVAEATAAETVDQLRQQAEQGNAEAQNKLAGMYHFGQNVPQDDREAVAWWQKAADQGLAEAQNALSAMPKKSAAVGQDDSRQSSSANSSPQVANNPPQAPLTELQRLQQAAEQGDAEAQYFLGVMYANGRGVAQDDRQAVAWWLKAAEQGYAIAQYLMGAMYTEGRGVVKDDRQAVAWYRKAADQGYRDAQVALGNIYFTGRGVPQDHHQAMAWYRKAADQGDTVSQLVLGTLYAEGRDVRQDDRQAAAWYQKAANQGYAPAQFNLGTMYFQGRGVAQNYIEAYAWFILVAANGDSQQKESAIQIRDSLQQILTPGQIAAGQERARVLQAGIERQGKLAKTPAGQAPSPDMAPSGNGSGFLINGGYVVTCAHVVKDAQRIVIRYQGAGYAASVVRQDAGSDLAVLKVSGLNTGAMPRFTVNTRLGDRVFTLGFPHLDLQGDTVKYTDGAISGLTGPGNAPLYYQISVPVQSGNSGGPLFDEAGHLVGVVAAKLNAVEALRLSGDLTQNVNYAVKADYLLPILKSIEGLPPPSFSPQPFSGEKSDVSSLIARLEPFAVLVLVY